MSTFTKPAISPENQLALLIERGLEIQDPQRAVAFLEAVSFFRLTPYMRPFQTNSDQHTFKKDAGFRQLAELYDFDRRLRLLIMDAIERAEVAVRAQISNHMGVKYGAHWYLERNHFKAAYHHHSLLAEIKQKQAKAAHDYKRECQRIDKLRGASEDHKKQLKLKRQQESYARHYALTYEEPSLMPNWAMLEELTLGSLSHLYKQLARDADRKAIAKALKLEAPLLDSWLHTLTVVRNICAHHSRLWNRELGIKPATPRNNRVAWPRYLKQDNQALHTRISVILPLLQHFINHCAPHSSWKQRLFDLFSEFPDIPLHSMGLPAHWEQDPFWTT